jgi:thioredoxin reductase (NADPH)
MRTARPGLFAAGDVRRDAAGQAITAAGDGATAAIAAHRYLTGRA